MVVGKVHMGPLDQGPDMVEGSLGSSGICRMYMGLTFVQLHPLEQWGSSVSVILVLYAGGSSVGHRRDQ